MTKSMLLRTLLLSINGKLVVWGGSLDSWDPFIKGIDT